ncbi:uncharacterized protein TNCV_1675301 [Trichonephila clavipes]|nr:uncharacterized protein TNCV_1675301 [Trichonephila clavipes]
MLIKRGKGVSVGRIMHVQSTEEERVAAERRARYNSSTNHDGRQICVDNEISNGSGVSCSLANPTPLAHADASRDVLPRGGTSQESNVWVFEDDPIPTMVKRLRAMKKVMYAVFFKSTALVKAMKLEGQKISAIITLPPDVDELTDEEYFDDDEMSTLSVKDLSGNVEICVPMEEIEVKEHTI